MATCGCGCVYNATEIATADGVTTITVADGVLTDLCNRKIVNVGIFTAFTETSKCNEIEVTDGTTTLTIYNSGRCEGQPANQYWRPCALPCRKVLELRYLADPAVLVLRKVKVV